MCCCCSVVVQSLSCPTLRNPINRNMPRLTHVHWVSNAIQPSHFLSPSCPQLSQHQGLFQWVGSSHQMAKVLVLQLQHPVNIQGWFPLGLTGLISLLSSSVSHSVTSNSLRPHGLQHASFSCPSPTPGAYSNSCPLSRWCHPTISSSVVPFSSNLQCFPASGSFPVSKFFTSGG